MAGVTMTPTYTAANIPDSGPSPYNPAIIEQRKEEYEMIRKRNAMKYAMTKSQTPIPRQTPVNPRSRSNLRTPLSREAMKEVLQNMNPELRQKIVQSSARKSINERLDYETEVNDNDENSSPTTNIVRSNPYLGLAKSHMATMYQEKLLQERELQKKSGTTGEELMSQIKNFEKKMAKVEADNLEIKTRMDNSEARARRDGEKIQDDMRTIASKLDLLVDDLKQRETHEAEDRTNLHTKMNAAEKNLRASQEAHASLAPLSGYEELKLKQEEHESMMAQLHMEARGAQARGTAAESGMEELKQKHSAELEVVRAKQAQHDLQMVELIGKDPWTRTPKTTRFVVMLIAWAATVLLFFAYGMKGNCDVHERYAFLPRITW